MVGKTALCGGGFIVKLIQRKLQGPSLAWAPSKALGRALINIHFRTKFCISNIYKKA